MSLGKCAVDIVRSIHSDRMCTERKPTLLKVDSAQVCTLPPSTPSLHGARSSRSFRGVCPQGKTQKSALIWLCQCSWHKNMSVSWRLHNRESDRTYRSHSRKQEYPHTSRLEINAGCTLRPQVCTLKKTSRAAT